MSVMGFPGVVELLHGIVAKVDQNKTAFAFSLLFLAVAALVRKLISVDHDPREPPIIWHPVPFIGHIIDMFRHGASYFDFVNKEHNYPIYTLPTLTGRTYIITSPGLAALIQRASKATSFYAAILEVTRRLCAFDDRTMKIVMRNADGHEGNFGVMPESHDMIAGVLGPGPLLNDITRLQLEIFSQTIRDLDSKIGQAIDLLDCLRGQFALASGRAFYGAENPFALDPSLVKDFWVFEQGMLGLLADVLPSVFTRKAYLARKRMLAALVEYVKAGRHEKASVLIQRRVTINLKHGLTQESAAGAELIMLFTILGNAVPVTFWLLVNIYSRPELLDEVRSEIEKCISVTKNREGKEIRTIHVDSLKSAAPVLTSSFRETLRIVANLASVRGTVEDMIIGDRYLLKKGSMVQVASGVIHMDEAIWGPDAKEFNPRRFIDQSEKTATAQPLPKSVPSAAFRAFGGGSVICPGRHFAQSEVVAFVAAMVMGFNMERPSGGPIDVPKPNNIAIPLAAMKPMEECRVVLTKRRGFEDIIWELDL